MIFKSSHQLLTFYYLVFRAFLNFYSIGFALGHAAIELRVSAKVVIAHRKNDARTGLSAFRKN